MKNWQMREKFVAVDQGLSEGTLRMSAEQWGQTKWKGAWSSYMYKNLNYRWVDIGQWGKATDWTGHRLPWFALTVSIHLGELGMASVTIILKGKLLNEEILTWDHCTGSDNRLWVWGSHTEASSIVLTSEGWRCYGQMRPDHKSWEKLIDPRFLNPHEQLHWQWASPAIVPVLY